MVQRKVPNKLGIQADHHFHHVKSDKRLANFSQDGKTRGGADMKKKMKKPRTIKLSHVEVLKSPPPPKKNFSLHVHHPTTNVSCSSPQKMTPLIRTNDGSPNYMKSTSSSDAKKELFPVSIRNSKASNSSKSSGYVSAKKPAKALAKSSPSLKLVRTLTKAPSFKKSSKLSLCAADVNNAQRATCSSTLKDSKFPPYLMLSPGATESEGTSSMKVCPYTYCSLNGHHHAPLPPLKSFLSGRRRILKTQKSMKQENLSPRKLKVPCEPKKESDTDMDFFIEIYAKKNGEEENIKPTMEESNFVTQEYYGNDDMKQVVASLSDGSPKSEIDSDEDYGKYIDDVKIEADLKGGLIQEQEAEFAGEKHVPIWSGKELSIGSCCSEISNEGEILDGSDTEATDMEWEHGNDDDDDADSSVLTEENDSKVELLSESSHDVSVMWLDDIIDIYYEDIVSEVSQKSNAKGSYCFESQHDGINCDMEGKDENLENQECNETVIDATVQSLNFPEKTLELVETEEEYHEINDALGTENLINKESLNLENDEADCISSIQDDSSMSHAYQIPDPPLAETNNRMEEEDNVDFKEEKVGDCTNDASQDCCEVLKVHSSQGQKVSGPCEADKVSEEENNSTNKWKGYERRKRAVEDEDEMRKFNPREPNFLPLVPDPEAEKVDLKHQMMDERKNAEEWMVDYALRQTVSKLAPARKRKVALLVEAFESVTPIPKYESHMRSRSSFAHPRPIQACR